MCLCVRGTYNKDIEREKNEQEKKNKKNHENDGKETQLHQQSE